MSEGVAETCPFLYDRGMWFAKMIRKARRAVLKTDPDFRDPFNDPTAGYYARIYLHHLDAFLESFAPRRPLSVLDAGCNTGRLAVPIAQRGHEVTALDPSSFSLHQAKRHAEEAGVAGRMRFVKGSLDKLAGRFEPFDVVVSTEVLYLLPDVEAALQTLGALAAPGGLLFVSHRTRFFYIAQALARRDFEAARFAKEHAQGELWGSRYNWQSEGELRQLYERAGLDVLAAKPVGVFSEGSAEGMGKLADLSALSETERESLFEIERAGLDELASAGRYILIEARAR